MSILAIDTSTRYGSVALLSGGSEVALRCGDEEETYSSRLFRWLAELDGRLGGGLIRIGAVALTVGPGSFTGLRIGAAAAKGLALAAGCPLHPFPTLMAAAMAAGPGPALRLAVIPAGRGQLYWAVYEVRDGRAQQVCSEQVGTPEQINPPARNQPVLLCGCGAPLLGPGIRPNFVAARNPCAPLAGAMATATALSPPRIAGVSTSELRLLYVRKNPARPPMRNK